MNKSLMTGIGVGIVVAAAAGAVASFSTKKGEPSTAAAIEQVAPDGQIAVAGDAVAEGAVANVENVAVAEPVAAVPAAIPQPSRAASPRSGTASAPAFAKVIASTPVVETEKVAREVCHDVEVQRQKPVQDEKRVAGAALGAVVGGVLGHQIGDGDGRKLATAAGAIAGGVAGSKIQKRVQQGNLETVTERQCETVYDSREKTLGYDVRYRVGDAVQAVRLSNDPGVGAQLPLRNGKLIAQTAGTDRERS